MTRHVVTMVFPARAGMIRFPRSRRPCGVRIPRESGDDPSSMDTAGVLIGYSPRERG